MSAPIVFFDIAGPDNESLKTFYGTLFGWDIAADGGFTAVVSSPTTSPASLMATIRKDSMEKVIYIGVQDITAKLNEIEQQGGSVDQSRFEVPGVVVLGLFKDPAGNRMGLVEMKEGKARVP